MSKSKASNLEGDEPIGIVTYEDTQSDVDNTLGPVGDLISKLAPGRIQISPQTLQSKLKTFLMSMNTVLADVPLLLGDYGVEEIELSLEVGAEGELSLLGTGGKLTGKSGITLTLKRIGEPKMRP